jgi:DNA-binding NtrC family response regulator
MAKGVDSLSVMVIDEESAVLSFFASILNANGIRALLARNADEAIGIANRGYVPIDVVLTDILLKPSTGAPGSDRGIELVARLRKLRPEVRVLYMSAHLDSEVIRIELMDGKFAPMGKQSDNQGLIEAIRTAAGAPLVRAAGFGAALTSANRIS